MTVTSIGFGGKYRPIDPQSTHESIIIPVARQKFPPADHDQDHQTTSFLENLYKGFKIFGKVIQDVDAYLGTAVIVNGCRFFKYWKLNRQANELGKKDLNPHETATYLELKKVEKKAYLNSIIRLMSSCAYLAGIIIKNIPQLPAWSTACFGAFIVSAAAIVVSIKLIYKDYQEYSQLKAEIKSCKEILSKLDLKTPLGKMLKKIYEKKIVSLENKIKNKITISLINNVIDILISSLGIAVGIALLVGAPYLFVPLYIGVGVCYAMKCGIAIFNYVETKKTLSDPQLSPLLIKQLFRLEKQEAIVELKTKVAEFFSLFNEKKQPNPDLVTEDHLIRWANHRLLEDVEKLLT